MLKTTIIYEKLSSDTYNECDMCYMEATYKLTSQTEYQREIGVQQILLRLCENCAVQLGNKLIKV